MNKDAYYFPHFSNARNDNKILKLRRVLGVEGYGLYFLLLEVLRDQTGFKMPLESLEDLAYEWHVSKEKLQSVVATFGLFEIDNQENFFSVKFNEYMTPYLEGKERRRIGGLKGNLIKNKHITKEQSKNMTDQEIEELDDKIKTAKNEGISLNLPKRKVTDSLPTPKASQSKVKESKVKESKVNNKYIYPTEQEFIEYAMDKAESLSIDLDITKVKLKYSSWSEANWHNGFGKKIKIWKSTLSNALIHLKKDENFRANTNSINNNGFKEDTTTKALNMAEQLKEYRKNNPYQETQQETVEEFCARKGLSMNGSNNDVQGNKYEM